MINNITSMIDIIASCGHPQLFLWRVTNDSVSNIEGYDGLPALEGTTVRFSCPPGMSLTELNSATCTENGEWELGPLCIKSKGNILI